MANHRPIYNEVKMMQNKILGYQQYVQKLKQEVTEISPKTYLQSNSRYPVLIDVRESQECQTGILLGAQMIPRGLLEAKLMDMPICQQQPKPLEWLAEQNILLYCHTGSRSALAAHSLQQMGFSKVFSLAGGVEQWRKLDLPITNSENR
jgi:rhodanese-related sulfurtransferase